MEKKIVQEACFPPDLDLITNQSCELGWMNFPWARVNPFINWRYYTRWLIFKASRNFEKLLLFKITLVYFKLHCNLVYKVSGWEKNMKEMFKSYGVGSWWFWRLVQVTWILFNNANETNNKSFPWRMTCNRSYNRSYSDANNSAYSSSICSICDMRICRHDRIQDSFIQQLLVLCLFCVQTIRGLGDLEINKIAILEQLRISWEKQMYTQMYNAEDLL